MIQHSLAEIELRVVTPSPLTPAEEDGLRQVARKALGYPFEISITRSTGRLPVSANGKFEEFISRVT
jgi:hypothetical protein